MPEALFHGPRKQGHVRVLANTLTSARNHTHTLYTHTHEQVRKAQLEQQAATRIQMASRAANPAMGGPAFGGPMGPYPYPPGPGAMGPMGGRGLGPMGAYGEQCLFFIECVILPPAPQRLCWWSCLLSVECPLAPMWIML